MFSIKFPCLISPRLLPLALTLCAANAFALPTPVDLRSWTAHNTTGGTAGKWVVAPGGVSVTQTANANPTFFVSNDNYLNTTLRTTVRVDDTDNDLIGLVFGYKTPATNGNNMDFLLFDWRQSAQTSSGARGEQGFALSRVNGTINNFLPGFWGHQDGTGFSVLGTNYGNTLGWARGTDYQLTVQYNAERIRIDVAGGAFGVGRNVFDLAGTFNSGGIGFYNYSQPQVTFSKVTLETRDSNPVSEPGSMALLGIALCGVLISRRGSQSTTARRGAGQTPTFG